MRRTFHPTVWAFGACFLSGVAAATPTWWFDDPSYPGDYYEGTYRALGGQPSFAWYDDDVPWVTGSVVRLPEDANYLGDVLTTIHCYANEGGGTQTMHSPYFVGADGKTFFFNHLETRFLPTTGWYNAGAVIGLTGGGTCVTGHGTSATGAVYSTGPHFCIETANQHPDVDFRPGDQPTSSCTHSDGNSGMANILCHGANCGQFTCGTTLYWNCQSDGDLHSCDGSGNAVTRSCQSRGCHLTGTCTDDVCNTPPPDAGAPEDAGATKQDAGSPSDAGLEHRLDAGRGAESADTARGGCGYGLDVSGASSAAALLLAALAGRRRSRRVS